uniref:Anaphase-promoting complex subunit 2 n=1 Tax=Fundulus heteroclitus TaxID=8078 RepID=A0A3Q2QRJ5_FUNHE
LSDSLALLCSHGLGRLLGVWLLETLQVRLSSSVVPEFWSGLRQPENELEERDRAGVLLAAFRTLLDRLEPFLGLEKLGLWQEAGRGGLNGPGPRALQDRAFTTIRALLLFSPPAVLQERVLEFYSRTFSVYMNREGGEDGSEAPEGPDGAACPGCAVPAPRCWCQEALEQLQDLSLIRARLQLLEWVSSEAVTSILHRLIEQRMEQHCRGEYERSFLLEFQEQWLELVLGWLGKVFASEGDGDAAETAPSAPGVHGSKPGGSVLKQWRCHMHQFFCRIYVNMRIEELFSIIRFPESKPAIEDLKFCLERTNQRQQLLSSLKSAFESRLLHPDMADSRRINSHIREEESKQSEEEQPPLALSAIILSSEFWPTLKEEKLELPAVVCQAMEAYTRRYEKLKAMRTLSWKPHLGSVTLDVELEDRTLTNLTVSPIQAAIILHFQEKTREDTVRQIVAGLTGDAEACNDLASELSRGDPVTLEMQDSDDEGNDPEDWTPDPTDAVPKLGSKRRSSDIISLLVSIYGSKDIFIDEYRGVLAERLLHQLNYNTAEIRNVELLKLRFGESHMHYCEVMLKVHTSDILTVYISAIKALRELDPSMVILQVACQPIRKYLSWTLEELSVKLGAPKELVHRKLAVWQQHGVLREEAAGRYSVLETGSSREKVDRGVMLIDSDEERDSNTTTQSEQREEKLQLFWAYIQAMLTNLDSMTLERIHSMLRLFVATGPVVTEMDINELDAFLQRKVREHQLIVSTGIYRLP